MSFPCQCPPKVGEPIPYKAYTCEPSTIYLNYLMSLLLLRAPYYNYIQTGINQAPELRKQYSYIVPIYLFKYYSILDPQVVLKTYNYEEVFQLKLTAEQYKTLEQVPVSIKSKWDSTDIEFYTNLQLLPMTEKLYQSILLANQQRALGLKYSYTFTIPPNVYKILKNDIPEGQSISKCYSENELITISRNAQLFVNAYLFKGMFPDFKPDWN